jgi:branched-chain amino acid aminotransferase
MMRQLLPRCAPRAASFFAPRRSTLGFFQAARQYSISPETASETKLQDIDPTQLVLQKTTDPKALKKSEDLVFGQNFTGEPSAQNHDPIGLDSY